MDDISKAMNKKLIKDLKKKKKDMMFETDADNLMAGLSGAPQSSPSKGEVDSINQREWNYLQI